MARPANPELRPALIEAALEEFAAHGLRAAKVAEITRRAGVSKGAFYLCFESKEALWEQLTRSFLDGLLELLTRYDCLHGRHPSPELLREMLAYDAAICEYLFRERRALRMIYSAAPGTPHGQDADEMVDAIQGAMKATFTRKSSEDVALLRPGFDPDAVATFLTGAMLMAARSILRDDCRPDPLAMSIQLRRLLFGGLFVPEVAEPLIAMLDASAGDPASAEAFARAIPDGPAAVDHGASAPPRGPELAWHGSGGPVAASHVAESASPFDATRGPAIESLAFRPMNPDPVELDG